MPRIDSADRITLTEATLIARRSRERVLRLIVAGRIRAEYDTSRPVAFGRWTVSRRSVLAFVEAEHAKAPVAAVG